MATWEQFIIHHPRLPDPTTNESLVDILDAELSEAAKDALVTQLETRIDAVIEAEKVDLRATIRDIASRLPVDDPLRLAIEAV